MENIFDWNCPARKRACGADLGEGDAVGNGIVRKCGPEMGPAEMRAGNGIVRQCGPEMGSCGNAGRKWDRAAMQAGMGSCGNAGRKWGGQGENLRLKPGDRGVRMRPRIAGASWMTGL